MFWWEVWVLFTSLCICDLQEGFWVLSRALMPDPKESLQRRAGFGMSFQGQSGKSGVWWKSKAERSGRRDGGERLKSTWNVCVQVKRILEQQQIENFIYLYFSAGHFFGLTTFVRMTESESCLSPSSIGKVRVNSYYKLPSIKKRRHTKPKKIPLLSVNGPKHQIQDFNFEALHGFSREVERCRLCIVVDVLSWSHCSIQVSSSGLNASFVSADVVVMKWTAQTHTHIHTLTLLSTSSCLVYFSKHFL